MSIKTIGVVLIIIGLVVVAVSLLADMLGIGNWTAAIGPRQLAGAAAGLVVAVVGLVLALWKGSPGK